MCYNLVFTLADEGDLQDVRSTVADLAGTWKDLGISLGISWCKLEAIHSHSPRRCLTEMLALWLKQSYNVRTIPLFPDPYSRHFVALKLYIYSLLPRLPPFFVLRFVFSIIQEAEES